MVRMLRNFSLILDILILPEVKYFSKLKLCDTLNADKLSKSAIFRILVLVATAV